MLNYLWSFMILAGIMWGAANNTLDLVTQSILDSAGDAVKLCLTMAGIMSFWCGILEIGNRAGLIEWLAEKMSPILSFLFPELEKDHPARVPIAVNMVANMLGLGMAATPAGLLAMKLLGQETRQNRASDAMCTFLIINISSLQLVPVSMIAYRSQYGSENPAAILGPALIATGFSTLAAVIFCKLVRLWKVVAGK
ncbi:nucleoside recognition domain-containing protein [Candidatus Ventrimonas sp. KK005]|nr:nucleoside recognition protein [Clostridiaceae bacterium]